MTPSCSHRFRRCQGKNKIVDVTPIKTKRDYQRALKEIEAVMDAKRGTPQGDRLDVLVTLVEAWEAKHRIRLSDRI
jgi:antitoxin component HigA of HigAB toxin-antitoxin module